jgi:nitrogen regulatory protein P-II 1
MKYIVAIIQPSSMDEVLDRLTAKEIHLVTVSNVIGRGRQKGKTPQVYRSHTKVGNLIRKVKLEIAVNDDFVDAAVEAIEGGARTGEIGDGKIFVLDLEQTVRIRTGERGGTAIG